MKAAAQGKESVQKSLFGTTSIDQVVPLDHPLRVVRQLFDEVFKDLAPSIEERYSTTGKPGIPPAVFLRVWLLQALYSIQSERALCEQISMNAGFRWFVGLDWDEPVFDHSILSRCRDRLLGAEAAEAILGRVAALAERRGLLSSDRMVVDGTLIRAWASHKSFQPKKKDDGPQDPPSSSFRGRKRSNATHESTSDPDSRLMLKGDGQEAFLEHLGMALVDWSTGFISPARVFLPGGSKRAAEHMRPGQTLVGDRGFGTSAMVGGLRELGIRPHIRTKSSRSALDRRTTSKAAYKERLTRLFIVEGAFGWLKQEGRMRQAKVRGREKVDCMFLRHCCAFNLVKMARHIQQPKPSCA